MADMNSLIFVGGIHGVGKSTLCARVCSDLGIQYLLASKLIKDAKNDAHEMSKRVSNIANNQNHLVAGLKRIVVSNSWHVLDGHFTLFDSNGYVREIPHSTFRDIKPTTLIVLTDKPHLIRERLLKRDGTDYDVNMLANMQESELQHARLIGVQLNLEVYEISMDSADRLKGVISNIVKKGYQ